MKFCLTPFAVAASVALFGCRPATSSQDAARTVFGGGFEWVDLSHAFSDSTIYWPTAKPFRRETVHAGPTPAGYYYSAYNFSAAEHGGTHLDAPVHFVKGRHTADAIPLHQLMGAAVVIDVRDSASANADYLVGTADLERWETAHGRIPDGAIVLLRTGWSARWPDRARYLGTADTGVAATTKLHFPGLDSSAARWLTTQRRIAAAGLDTPSIDHGPSTAFWTHRILMAADIPAFENVTALDRLPEAGAWIVALPMKIAGGSGGPLRIVAAVPR